MTDALPPTVARKLKQTLAQWRHWHAHPPLEQPPQVVSVLTAGVSNFSVLAEAQTQFVVRIDGVNPASHGLNRQGEWRILQAAHRAGLAPCPRYFNPDLGSLVCDYLAHDPSQQAHTQDTARLLRDIHCLPPTHHRLNLAERLLRYEKQLEHSSAPLTGELASARNTVMALLQDSSHHDTETVLCHNDLLRANRIYSGGKLHAIDWEYAAMASPWYDLAVVIHGDELPTREASDLVRAYLGRAPRNDEQLALHRYGCIYRYLELLWYLALQRPVLDAAALAAKTAALSTLLQDS